MADPFDVPLVQALVELGINENYIELDNDKDLITYILCGYESWPVLLTLLGVPHRDDLVVACCVTPGRNYGDQFSRYWTELLSVFYIDSGVERSLTDSEIEIQISYRWRVFYHSENTTMHNIPRISEHEPQQPYLEYKRIRGKLGFSLQGIEFAPDGKEGTDQLILLLAAKGIAIPSEERTDRDDLLRRCYAAVDRMIAVPKERKIKGQNRTKKVPQRKFEDRRLADELKMTTNTLYKLYKLYPGLEQQVKEYFDSRKDSKPDNP